MFHRVREAMRSVDLAPMGGGGGQVEADQTFIGREPGKPVKRAYHHKMKVLSPVDRETGQARSFVVDDVKARTLVPILRENIANEAQVMTDEANQYRNLLDGFAGHDSVDHGGGEYGRGTIHTNTAAFDFRYHNRAANGVDDTTRARKIILGAEGKCLTYCGLARSSPELRDLVALLLDD